MPRCKHILVSTATVLATYRIIHPVSEKCSFLSQTSPITKLKRKVIRKNLRLIFSLVGSISIKIPYFNKSKCKTLCNTVGKKLFALKVEHSSSDLLHPSCFCIGLSKQKVHLKEGCLNRPWFYVKQFTYPVFVMMKILFIIVIRLDKFIAAVLNYIFDMFLDIR